MKNFRAVISGRVQGVGFRFFTERQANKLGLVGTVKNLYDGSVEVCAQGEDEVINRFIELLYKGPSFSYVSDIDFDWDVYKPNKGQTDFRITF